MADTTYTPLGTYNDAGLTPAQQAQVLAAKEKWAAANAAGDTEGMKQAHLEAETVRSTAFGNSGYSGGADGTQFLSNGQPVPTTGGQMGSNLAGLLGQLNPNGVRPTMPMQNGLALGDLYGLNYDYNSILSILNNATKSAYDSQLQLQKQNENNYFNDLYATQGATLDTLRQTQAKAVATGASKGIAAANELSSILNLQNTTAKTANDLANNSNNLAAERQAAEAKNAQTALDTSNSLKQAIGQLDLTKYGYDVQESIGILDYLASLASTAGGIIDSENTLSGVKYNADKNLQGSQYTADYGYGGSKNPYYGQSTQNSGSGSGSGSGTGSTPSGNTSTDDTTQNPDKPIDTEKTYTLGNDTATISQAADGSYILHRYNADGTPYETVITEAQMRAMRAEGSSEVINENYAQKAMIDQGPIQDGKTITVGDNTWKYSAAKYLWVNTKSGATIGSTSLRSSMANYNISHTPVKVTSTVSLADAQANPTAFNAWKKKVEAAGFKVQKEIKGWVVRLGQSLDTLPIG